MSDATEAKRPGLVLRVDGEILFLPASIAATVTKLGRVTHVAGGAGELLGITLHEGQVVPVVAIGAARDTMVVCSYLGEPIGLVGGDVVHAGIADVRGAKTIDLAAIYGRIQAGGWSARWGG